MKRLSVTKLYIASLLLILLSACGDGSNSGFPTADCGGSDDPCVSAFTITPNKSAILLGDTQTYQALATLTDGSETDITELVSWSVEDTAIAVIDQDDSLVVATGLANGVTIIAATYRGLNDTAALSVGAVTFGISPSQASILTGMVQPYQAFAILPNGVQLNITERVNWTSDSPSIATMSVDGANVVATGLTHGLAVISAEYNGASIVAQLTVINSVPETLVITPASLVMSVGAATQYSAYLTTVNNEVIDVTSWATWLVSDTDIASIDASAWLTAVAIGDTQVQATIVHDGVTLSDSAALTVNQATLSNLVISPNNGKFPVGKMGVYHAEAYFSDGNVINVTREVSWSIADSKIGSIVGSGVFGGDSIALTPGKTTVSATFLSVTASTNVEVTAAEIRAISLSPHDEKTPVGTVINYQAYAFYSDGSKRNITELSAWSSSDPSIAAVGFRGGKSGQANAFNVGVTDISVTYQDITQSTSLTVSDAVVTKLQISPLSPEVPVGIEGQFRAIAYYSDHTTSDVTDTAYWVVDDYSVVTVVPTGELGGYAEALAQGSALLTASFDGQSVTTRVTVTAAVLESLSLSPPQVSVPAGTTQQYQVFGVFTDGTNHDLTTFASYQSSEPHVASIDSSALASAHIKSENLVTITASYIGMQATASLSVSDGVLEFITVIPAKQNISVGHKGQLQAFAFYTDGLSNDVSQQAAWSVENGDIASVDNTNENAGVVLGISEGVDTVTASFKGEIATNITTVTAAVLESVSITPVSKTVAAGLTQQYRLFALFSDRTSREVTNISDWLSGDPVAATIDPQGLATTYQEWQTVITGTYQGLSASASLTITDATPSRLQVTPVNPSKPLGTVSQFVATVYYTDGYAANVTQSATWTSSNTDIVQITASGASGGTASADKVGVSEITATIDGLSAKTNARVTAAVLSNIYINPVISSTDIGDRINYQAICKFSDGSFHNLPSNGLWQSSNIDVATIQVTGVTNALATAIGEGTTIITARVGDIVSNEAVLNVTPLTLTAIQVTPAIANVAIDAQQQFIATAYYSNGSSGDVTTQATWLSDNTDIVNITPIGDNGGFAHAISAGIANITAVLNTVISNRAQITVASKTLDNVQITPNNKSYKMGQTEQYKVSAVYDDLSLKDVTAYSQIQSLSPNVATFDANNMMTAVGSGTAELTTVYQGVTSEREFLHVSAPSPISPTIEITPVSIDVPQGTLGRYTATLYYADNTIKNITQLVAWSSADTSIINILPTGENAGFARAVGIGMTTISADFEGLTSNTATISVKEKELVSIEIVVEDDAIFPKGTTKHFTAFATYNDESVVDITRDATWKIDDTAVAVVIKGLVYGVNIGTTNVNIYFGGKENSQGLTVTNAVATALAITPSYYEMAVHTTLDFTVIARLSDGTTENVTNDVIKSSSGTADIEIIDQEELFVTVEGITTGNAIVKADYDNLSANANLVIIPATLDSISITPLDETISLGSTLQYQAKALYSDGSEVNITKDTSWKSMNTSIASIQNYSNAGIATGVSTGSTTIQATFKGVSTSTSLTVGASCGNKKPDTIYIRPENAIISLNTEMQYTLFGLWFNGCTAELTQNNAGNWSSSDNKLVAIGKKNGIALAKKVGATKINANYQSLTATSVNVTVTNEEVLSVSIQPAPSAILAKGGSLSYLCSARTAINGIEQAEKFVTGLASYSSSDTRLAVIGSNNGTYQTITALSIAGNTTITCSYGGKDSQSKLTIQ
ncbi:hypothetical protein CXF83_07945 [Shewanella sp. Choline-02u-19]|uniref:Ig-like domain-containing protein n=1 Tax=unclassified Shewanella TaxID=196818 RepID=UPI000C33DF9C|nr:MULTISPECIES: Ig-like domain-containing protein [unclassified Shewanella]PKH54905.1 hypothetical protein CXF84_18925 [Shewanella sp. Bg11-22]PKI26677.1 hypothetical protein CXF83_07945 [Shewanella sp. Choline-02u-19]